MSSVKTLCIGHISHVWHSSGTNIHLLFNETNYPIFRYSLSTYAPLQNMRNKDVLFMRITEDHIDLLARSTIMWCVEPLTYIHILMMLLWVATEFPITEESICFKS